MELIIGFVIAIVLAIALAEDERLGEDNERAWINHLADESKRTRHGRAHKYSRAGVWRI